MPQPEDTVYPQASLGAGVHLCPHPGAYSNRNVQESEVKVSPGHVPPEGSRGGSFASWGSCVLPAFLGLWPRHSNPYFSPHITFSLKYEDTSH